MSTSAFSPSNCSSCPSSEEDTPTSSRRRRPKASPAKRRVMRSTLGGEQGMMGSAGMCKSSYRGVSYDKKKRKWRVQIKVATLGKSGVSVGYFDTEEAAARAYDRAAISLLGRTSNSLVTNYSLEEYDGEEVPDLVGKDRHVVKLALRSERIKRAVPRRRQKCRTSKGDHSVCPRRSGQWQAQLVMEGSSFATEDKAAHDRAMGTLHGASAASECVSNVQGREDLLKTLGLLNEESENRSCTSLTAHATPECSSVNTMVHAAPSPMVASTERWQSAAKRVRMCEGPSEHPQPPLSAFLPDQSDAPLLLDMIGTDTLLETSLWGDATLPPAMLSPSAYATPWTECIVKSDSLLSESFCVSPSTLQRSFQGMDDSILFPDATPCAMLLDGLLHCGADEPCLMAGLVAPMPQRMPADMLF